MANVALGKKLQEPHANAVAITDGQTTGYSGRDGFTKLHWAGYATIDLDEKHRLFCIRILLYDGLGRGGANRDPRIYKYRLLTSIDGNSWRVIFDTYDKGYNGWQVFDFQGGLEARFIRLHCLWNSANPGFHIVQIEAHDAPPPALTIDYTLKRTITEDIAIEEEQGDGLPLSSKLIGIIDSIEQLVESTEFLNPQPFRDLLSQLRIQVSDVASIEESVDGIRREILQPVKEELDKSSRLSRFSVWGFWVGIIGGILAIISILITIFQP